MKKSTLIMLALAILAIVQPALAESRRDSIPVYNKIKSSQVRIVRMGSEGSEAKKVQLQLQGFGYRRVVADGKIEKPSHDAIVDYQRKRGLDPDGKVGRDTRKRMEKESREIEKKNEALAAAKTKTSAKTTTTPTANPAVVQSSKTPAQTATSAGLISKEFPRGNYVDGTETPLRGEVMVSQAKPVSQQEPQKKNGFFSMLGRKTGDVFKSTGNTLKRVGKYVARGGKSVKELARLTKYDKEEYTTPPPKKLTKKQRKNWVYDPWTSRGLTNSKLRLDTYARPDRINITAGPNRYRGWLAEVRHQGGYWYFVIADTGKWVKSGRAAKVTALKMGLGKNSPQYNAIVLDMFSKQQIGLVYDEVTLYPPPITVPFDKLTQLEQEQLRQFETWGIKRPASNSKPRIQLASNSNYQRPRR